MVPSAACVVVLTAASLAAGCGGGSGAQPSPQPAPATSASATPSRSAPAARRAASPSADWPRFGGDAARTGVSHARLGLSASNVKRLRRQVVRLPGTVDSSPLYLHGADVAGRRRDVFVVTTQYGQTLALDARDGRPLWTFTPAGIGGWKGTAQFTTASPVADLPAGVVYATSPDGRIHKLRLRDGGEAGGAWPVALTRDPSHEKLAAPLNLDRGRLIAATGGYLGDAPPYQGHVVTLDAANGKVRGVFNALCADRHAILDPRTCSESGAAIWGRNAPVVEPSSGRLLVATGDGAWDGRRSFGDSVLVLSPTAGRLEASYTPSNQAELDAGDVDLGSSAPALLPGGLALQAGKDGIVRLLDLARMTRGRLAGPGQIQALPAPGGSGLFSAPAVVRLSGRALAIVANQEGTTAYELSGRRLKVRWANRTAGTSPVVASGLLWIYDFVDGGLRVYEPGSGRLVATLPSGPGHWNSPAVGRRVVALPEGDANQRAGSGTLDLYRAP